MREAAFDQAAGLAALRLQPPTRVLPIVETSAARGSWELMWQLEQRLTAQGESVAVVEGTHGLRVHDARQGPAQVLAYWLEGVPAGSVVLLHAPLEALAVLLADSQARPLVALAGTPRGAVEAYNALKVLSQVAGLSPVVISLPCAPHGDTQSSTPRTQMLDALRTNAGRHLGFVPTVWSLEYDASRNMGEWKTPDACVLKLLDTAMVLDDPDSPVYVHDATPHDTAHAADQIIGVSDVHRQRYA